MIKKTIMVVTILLGSHHAFGNDTICTKVVNILCDIVGVSGCTGVLPALAGHQALDLARHMPLTSKKSLGFLIGLYFGASQLSTGLSAIMFSNNSVLERTVDGCDLVDRNFALNVIEAAF